MRINIAEEICECGRWLHKGIGTQ